MRRTTLLVPLCCAALASCGGAPVQPPPSGPPSVVAAENGWGSIARSLAGSAAHVRSIIDSPNQDPHGYLPTAADARALAGARLVIYNGLGYDPWVARLLAANPVPGRRVLEVGRLLGLPAGSNPHQWYSPAAVRAVSAGISGQLRAIAPSRGTYLAARSRRFTDVELAPYDRLIALIAARYRGVAVGASESIFEPLAPALGLRLITPPGYMKATSEGTEPSAQDAAAVRAQISGRRIAVWVYNSQNETPDIRQLNAAAGAAGIPVTAVTETLAPPGASFGAWQAGQLSDLERALARATGR